MNKEKKEMDNRTDGELSDEDLDLVLGGVSAPELIHKSADHIANLIKQHHEGDEK